MGLFLQQIDACLFGIDRITPKLLKSAGITVDPSTRIGLITNQTGVAIQGKKTVDILHRQGLYTTHILAPEHGYWGTVPAGLPVMTMIDPVTNIPVVSLYGHGTGKKIDAAILDKLDLLVFDLQDSGMRHYTYVSLLYRLIEAASCYKKPIVILDRPNPLGGTMEGPLVEENLLSFISIAPIPLRHGMTLGELAYYFNKQFFPQAKVIVIPMHNYDRFTFKFSLHAPLSPNLANTQSVFGYSFLGLLGEISPFDVGIGTENAFSRLGLAKNSVDKSVWIRLIKLCKKHSINASFITYQHPLKKKEFEGLQLNFKNASDISTLPLLLDIVKIVNNAGVKLCFSPMFDKAIGSPLIQKIYAEDKVLIHLNNLHETIKVFYEKAQNCFLYKPWPKLVKW